MIEPRSDWPAYRLKQLVRKFHGGGTPDSGNASFYAQGQEGTPWLMISDMSRSSIVTRSRKTLTPAGVRSKNLAILEPGTVVYAMYASVGEVAQLAIPAAINQALIGIVPDEERLLARFLVYALETKKTEVLQEASASTQANLSAQKVKNIEILAPDVVEQAHIIRYLDNAELRIARAITAKISVLDLLRKAEANAIGREILGSVEMAGGQIDTDLGASPAHWDIQSLRGLLRPRVERNRSDLPLLSVLRSSGVIARNFEKTENHNFIPDDLSNYKVVHVGDLVINKMKAWSGSVGVSRFHGIASPAYFVYSFASENDALYMNFLFRSPQMRDQFARASRGVRVGQWDLNPEDIKAVRVPIPPMSEQLQIAERIQKRIAAIHEAIAGVEAEIALLREYRTKLISDVVTGKLDVREEAAKLRDLDPEELAAVLGRGSFSNDPEEDDDNADD